MGLGALGVLLQDEELLLRQRWQCQVPQRASPAQGPPSARARPCLSRQLMLLRGQVAIFSISLGVPNPGRSGDPAFSLVFLQVQLSDGRCCLRCGARGAQIFHALWLADCLSCDALLPGTIST